MLLIRSDADYFRCFSVYASMCPGLFNESAFKASKFDDQTDLGPFDVGLVLRVQVGQFDQTLIIILINVNNYQR